MRRIYSASLPLVFCIALGAALLGGAGSVLLGVCGPFTDVAADSFCPFVLELFTLGITTGTSPTTYDPTSNVNRLQMAAFLSRSVDGVLKRGSRRAALNQFWITRAANVGVTTIGGSSQMVVSDGTDLWAASNLSSIARVRASDGKLLETWTGATSPLAMLSAMGKIFIAGNTNPGNLYRIDPNQTAGAVTTVMSTLGAFSVGIAYDGTHIWTANFGSVSIITPTNPAVFSFTATTVTTGFNQLHGALYDGSNVWVADVTAGALLRLDPAGTILQTVTVGTQPRFPIFDGANIWVPNFNSNSVSVVRASSGALLDTLTGNGLNAPVVAAFDGQRILVTNQSGNSVSLWKAADLSVLGSTTLGIVSTPFGACSDGLNFWVVNNPGTLLRF